jgi:hypothetical protein
VVGDPEPAWVSHWRASGLSTADALSGFDTLPGAEPDDVIGRWRGESLSTGHPLDGLLEELGWHGKANEDLDRVHPLLFRSRSGHTTPVEPALMPARIALTWPALARSWPVRAAFAVLRPVLQTRRHAAKLRTRECRGKHGAAIVYKGQPIVDHLRRIDADRLLGLMERIGMERPFFFLLTRDTNE